MVANTRREGGDSESLGEVMIGRLRRIISLDKIALHYLHSTGNRSSHGMLRESAFCLKGVDH